MGIEVKGLKKSFGQPETAVLKNINLKIQERDFFAITGRSGSGKSTLLYILSTLDNPSSGQVSIDGMDVHQLSSKDLHQFRNQKMGFVFQFHYLLPELSALENVLMPARKGGAWAAYTNYAKDLLNDFGLSHRLNHRPSQLSGGEQQRVAIARSLVMRPRYLFADEPTGNLDSVNGNTVMSILKRFNQEHQTTVVYVTHDEGFAEMSQKRIHLVDGQISEKS